MDANINLKAGAGEIEKHGEADISSMAGMSSLDPKTQIELNEFLKDRKRLNNDRVDFSKVSGTMELPNLCAIQTESFKNFMEHGVEEEFEAFFPVSSIDPKLRHEKGTDTSKEMILEYVPGTIRWEKPEPEDPFEAKEKNKTYSQKLFATLALHLPDGTVSQEEVFFGDYPAMTESGTFIINGSERCIVSQIVRSPGAYISQSKEDKTGDSYGADIIPQRGTWLEFETDAKGVVNVRIDKQRKVSSITLLRALGLNSDEIIYQMFGTYSDNLNDTLVKTPIPDKILASSRAQELTTTLSMREIYNKLRPGEPVTDQGAIDLVKSRFFDAKHYSLGRAGRFKLTEKLGIYNRLLNTQLAEDLIDDETGEIVYPAGTILDDDKLEHLKNYYRESDKLQGKENVDHGYFSRNMIFDGTDPDCFFHINTALDTHGRVNIVKVYANGPDGLNKSDLVSTGKAEDELLELEEESPIMNIVGTDRELTVSYVTISDIFAIFSYMLNIMYGKHKIGQFDDIDNLSNRRINCVGESVQDRFRQGLVRMEKNIRDKMLATNFTADSNATKNDILPTRIINIKPLTSNLKDFFNSSQLSQFMDQVNPLAELTNKRRISALGSGGLSRDRASFEVRDVHFTHYGRICPIETPEGQNVGLINNLACYAKIDEHGFITTPYRPVHNHVIDQDPSHVVYLSAADERKHTIAQANVNIDLSTNEITDLTVVARHDLETIECSRDDVDLIDVSPKQIVSIASSCIPFLQNDDTTRALLGSNMERQALPLLRPHAPFVGTGMEHKIAHDSGAAVLAKGDGVVTYADSKTIEITDDQNHVTSYKLRKFAKSNQSTCINQTPIVHIGQKIKAGEIIADGPAMDNGDLALGQNSTIAFMTWHGYDYEDAVVMNEECRRKDTFTSIHIDEYPIDRRRTKLGEDEIFTNEIPNVRAEEVAHLDKNGIVIPGTIVKPGDILVGKVSPKGEKTLSPEEKLMQAIFAEKSKEGKDTSLRVPHGAGGIVQDVKIFSAKNGDALAPNVIEEVKVYIIQKRKITEGDKMSGRHGNKGVISKLVPQEDMPFLADGTPVDLCLNPLGVPSRMNIGQVIEIHLGEACKRLGGLKVSTPVFDGVNDDELNQMMQMAGLEKDGKCVVYDGQTGERFENRIAVGTMYMIKLNHMVADKVHSRSTGPYSLVTQQPLGGKAQNGGQRFGEMEVWALEAYGAAHVLQEMLTIKSDDMVGRNRSYLAMLEGEPIPDPSMPESFRVLLKELQGLGIDVKLMDKDHKPIDLDSLVESSVEESRSIQRDARNYHVDNQQRQDELAHRNGEIEEAGELMNTSSVVDLSEVEAASRDAEMADDGSDDE